MLERNLPLFGPEQQSAKSSQVDFFSKFKEKSDKFTASFRISAHLDALSSINQQQSALASCQAA